MVLTWECSLRRIGRDAVRVLFGVSILGVLLGSVGCKRHYAQAETEAPPADPLVKTAHPERVTFHRVIEQPAWIAPFEVTPIYAKISGFVQEVRVNNIGVRVHKDDLLAKLWVPELVEESKQKSEQVHQAEKILAVAEARIEVAKAQVRESQAALARFEATHHYWKGQSERFTRIGKTSEVMDKQSVEEAVNQYRAAAAGVKEAEAKIESARANLLEMESTRDKAKADINVAQADERRVAALLSYAEIRAPYDGIVSARHVHTRHFLQPSVAGNTDKAEPLFVVLRMDRVRVFLDVPEAEAVLVHDGAAATIRVPSLNNRVFRGTVAGSSWMLEPKQRTLRTEIDLDNPKEELHPGMYAHASIPVEHSHTFSLPASAVLIRDGQAFCFRVEKGKAVKTVIRIGVREGGRVEVLKKLGRRKQPGASAPWEDWTGKEIVIISNPGELTDGRAVQVERGGAKQ